MEATLNGINVNEDNIGITDRDASTLLKYAIASGSIDMNRLKSEYDMSIKQKYLEQHSYVIYEGKDGEWYTYLPDSSKKYNRKLVHRKNKEALEKVVCDYYAALEEKVPTFKEAFELMQKYTLSMKQVTDSTYLRREDDYNRFFNGTKFAAIPVDRITESDLKQFLDYLLRDYHQKIGRTALNNIKSLINVTLSYMRSEKHVDCIRSKLFFEDYTVPKNALRKPKKQGQIFYDDEMEAMINLIVEKYWNSIRHLGLLFIMFTGLRVGEAAVLCLQDFVSDSKLHIQRTLSKKVINGKVSRYVKESPKTTSSDEEILLSSDAATVVKQILVVREQNDEKSDWLFSEDGEYVTDNRFDKCLRSLCRELDIPERGCHKLRKTYCSELLELHVSEKIVQNQLRHSDIRTTQGHYNYSVKREAAIVKELDRNSKLPDRLKKNAV